MLADGVNATPALSPTSWATAEKGILRHIATTSASKSKVKPDNLPAQSGVMVTTLPSGSFTLGVRAAAHRLRRSGRRDGP